MVLAVTQADMILKASTSASLSVLFFTLKRTTICSKGEGSDFFSFLVLTAHVHVLVLVKSLECFDSQLNKMLLKNVDVHL